jgi:arylformamidase
MKIWDISLALGPNTPVWPGDPKVNLRRHRKISQGSPSNDSRLACSVHAGTHVDAPLHFLDDGLSVENLSLDILIGPAWVAGIEGTSVITPDVLETLVPREATRLIFKTSNSSLWNDPYHDFNSDYVALNGDAAEWIVAKGIRLVGIDYLSIERFPDEQPYTHRTLLGAGVVILEGLDLRAVLPGDYQLICLPLKLIGSDGAPARAVLLRE